MAEMGEARRRRRASRCFITGRLEVSPADHPSGLITLPTREPEARTARRSRRQAGMPPPADHLVRV